MIYASNKHICQYAALTLDGDSGMLFWLQYVYDKTLHRYINLCNELGDYCKIRICNGEF